MRHSAGRHTFQGSESPVHKDDPNYDEGLRGREVRKRKRASISENIPSVTYRPDSQGDELEEGELASNTSFQRRRASLSLSRSTDSVGDRSCNYSDYGSLSSSDTDPGDYCGGEIESKLRSLPAENCVKYTNPEELTGVVPVSNYIFSKKIGEGSFGEVIIATDGKTRKKVALKRVIIHKDTDGVPITALREILILKSLNHENIIRLKEIALSQGSKKDFTPGVIYMVFPYMEHDLAGLLDNPDVNLTPAQIKCYTRQLLEGIAYLHKEEILHRDMKSANVLIGDSGILKIADFGLARYYDGNSNSSELTPTVITVWYRPPELLMGSKVYTSAVDIWGAGCIFAELWDRKAIFAGQKEMDVLKKILQICGVPGKEEWSEFYTLAKSMGIYPRPSPKRIYERFKNTLDPTTIKFIRYMFTYDPSRRPTAAQALKHEYFYIDPPPARRNTSDFLSWSDSHELGTRLARAKDGNLIDNNVHVSKSNKKPRVHKDIILDSKGRVIPRSRIRIRNYSPKQDLPRYHRSSSSKLPTKRRDSDHHHYSGCNAQLESELHYYDREHHRSGSHGPRGHGKRHCESSRQHDDRMSEHYNTLKDKDLDLTERCSQHLQNDRKNSGYYREIERHNEENSHAKSNRSSSMDSSGISGSLENGECRER